MLYERIAEDLYKALAVKKCLRSFSDSTEISTLTYIVEELLKRYLEEGPPTDKQVLRTLKVLIELERDVLRQTSNEAISARLTTFNYYLFIDLVSKFDS